MKLIFLAFYFQMFNFTLIGRTLFFEHFSKLNYKQKNETLDNYLCWQTLDKGAEIECFLCKEFVYVDPADFAWYYLNTHENLDSVYFLDFFCALDIALTKENRIQYIDQLLDERFFAKLSKNDSLFDSRLVTIIKAHKELNFSITSQTILDFWKICEKKGWYGQVSKSKFIYYWNKQSRFHAFQHLISDKKHVKANPQVESNKSGSFFKGFAVGGIMVILLIYIFNKAKK